jgi:hypothetical protein
MAKSSTTQGKNTDPSPMTYEVQIFPSLAQERARLAMEAETMNATDLRTAAEAAQIDTSGAKNKTDLVERVRQGARGTDSAATATPTPTT